MKKVNMYMDVEKEFPQMMEDAKGFLKKLGSKMKPPTEKIPESWKKDLEDELNAPMKEDAEYTEIVIDDDGNIIEVDGEPYDDEDLEDWDF